MAIVHLVEFRVVPGHEAEVLADLRKAAPGDRHSAGSW
jgi:quinol monooxygenase YgiN